ncbi:MAG: winged helix-turn-helix transcriptional regulator, partial [Eggerthellaceae bacterium]|nr:winged helix-turn-helix transcriptional regulator [Eggerthellaceae bacterium]
MITYNLDERGSIPKYEFLHHCIRNDIRTGALPPRTKLPSKRSLAQHLGVSVSTVEQAYDLLVSESYLDAKPGSGFYVCPHRDEGTYDGFPDMMEEGDEKLDMRGN